MGPHAAKQLPDGDPTSVLRRAPSPTTLGWAPGSSAPTAHPRSGAPGVRRGGLPPVRRDPHHRGGRMLTGGLLPVLLEQGRRVPPPRRAGGAQLVASAEALGPITWTSPAGRPCRPGSRHGEIYDRYEPVFEAHQAAAESDEAIASGSAHRRPNRRRRARQAHDLGAAEPAARRGDRHPARVHDEDPWGRRDRRHPLAQVPSGASAYPAPASTTPSPTSCTGAWSAGSIRTNVHPPTKRRPHRCAWAR